MASPLKGPCRRTEFRVVLPMDVNEYQCAQLYAFAEASKNETGGGEGIEVLVNEPFDEVKYKPDWPLLDGRTTGQYTHKVYHLASKVPAFIRLLAPKGALEIHERAWNAYPYCRTLITNPSYMKEGFYINIETMHLPDNGETPNVHNLEKPLKRDEIKYLNIASAKDLSSADLNPDEDPATFKSQKTGRGPLTDPQWKDKVSPVMCCYKLVSVYFKWFGLQNRVESFVLGQYPRMFTKFHRQLFCQTDQWYGLTMEDIRKIEEETKKELDVALKQGEIKGTKVTADK